MTRTAHISLFLPEDIPDLDFLKEVYRRMLENVAVEDAMVIIVPPRIAEIQVFYNYNFTETQSPVYASILFLRSYYSTKDRYQNS